MITESLNKIINEIPSNVKLIAISKTKSIEEILEAYDHGQRIFGENKVQEMTEKYSSLPKDIKWHMVGHVQRNKIKYMASYVDLIHGIDSFKSLSTINKEGEKNNRIIKCLLQLKISGESTKLGIDLIAIGLNSEAITANSSLGINPGTSPVVKMALITSIKDSSLISASVKIKVVLCPN